MILVLTTTINIGRVHQPLLAVYVPGSYVFSSGCAYKLGVRLPGPVGDCEVLVQWTPWGFVRATTGLGDCECC